MSNAFIPNTAAIPNVLFDYWMSRLTPAQFKVLMCVARKTYGWRKHWDLISIKQIMEMTGLSKQGCVDAMDVLIGHGLVKKIKSKTPDGDDAPNKFEINLDCKAHETNFETENANSVPPGSQLSLLGVVNSVDKGVVNSVDTQKIIYTKDNTTTDKVAPSAPVVVFFPSLNKLDLSEKLKCDLSGLYSEADIDLAVKRCLAWKGRESDEVAIRHIFKNFNTWNDVVSQEETEEKNKVFFETLKVLDGKKLGCVEIKLGFNYIEFISGMKYTSFSLKDVNFECLVKEHLDMIKQKLGIKS